MCMPDGPIRPLNACHDSLLCDAASYASYLLARSGGSGSYGRPSQNSPAATSDRLHDMNMFRGGNPQPLLADVLAGGQLSNEALLDLRVSLADNLSMQCAPLSYLFASQYALFKI